MLRFKSKDIEKRLEERKPQFTPHTNATIIPEVAGAPDESGLTTKTDWPVYHGTDGNQTGYSPDTGPAKGKIAWRVAKGNFWYATPVIENGKVYTASPGADVMAYCFDEITGDIVWKGRQFGTDIYQTPGSIFSPVVSSNKVLFSTGWWQAGMHMVLNKNTGRVESQLAAGDTVGGGTAELMVYKHNRWNLILADATTGEGVWQFESGGNLSGDPVLVDGRVYAARQSGTVYCFDTGSKDPVWQRNLDVPLRGTPGISSTRLYVTVPIAISMRSTRRMAALSGAIRPLPLKPKTKPTSIFLLPWKRRFPHYPTRTGSMWVRPAVTAVEAKAGSASQDGALSR